MYCRMYPGYDLHKTIDNLVDKAFHKIYTYNEDNWYYVEEIALDYSTCEEGNDLPFVRVHLRCSTKFDGDFELDLEYSLDESDEFNLGRIYSYLVAHQNGE